MTSKFQHHNAPLIIPMREIVVHKNIRVSDVIVSDILDSDHLTTVFHILDHVKIRNLSEPIEKFTDWDRFFIKRAVSQTRRRIHLKMADCSRNI
jgi:hypothetical protein